jgi:hypothetical protein
MQRTAVARALVTDLKQRNNRPQPARYAEAARTSAQLSAIAIRIPTS